MIIDSIAVFPKASPIILEPIMLVEISAPEEYRVSLINENLLLSVFFLI